MKTTIEIHGYEIVVEENEGLVTVSALKEGEVVEEFELEGGEDQQVPSNQGDEGELKAFGEEEDDLGEDDEDFEGTDDEELDEVEDDEELGEEEGVEEEGKLESFNAFIRKRR